MGQDRGSPRSLFDLAVTQAELAERAGVRRAAASPLESGERKAVYFDVLDRLARALDIAPALLIEETPDHA